jgi:hypothetical protein
MLSHPPYATLYLDIYTAAHPTPFDAVSLALASSTYGTWQQVPLAITLLPLPTMQLATPNPTPLQPTPPTQLPCRHSLS